MSSGFRAWVPFGLILVLFLSASGCDLVGSSSEDTPDWVGDWKITQIDDEPVQFELYFSYSKEALVTIAEREQESGCLIHRLEITNVDGNAITMEFNGELETDRVNASGGSFTATTTRSNKPNSEGTTYRGKSIEGSPRELAGC